jgi:hypothetical protein
MQSDKVQVCVLLGPLVCFAITSWSFDISLKWLKGMLLIEKVIFYKTNYEGQTISKSTFLNVSDVSVPFISFFVHKL